MTGIPGTAMVANITQLVIRSLIGILLLSAIVINFVNVVARYLFQSPLIWVDEVLVYLLIWIVFLGVVLVTQKGQHLSMTLLIDRLTGFWGTFVRATSAILTILVSAFMAVQAYKVTMLVHSYEQESTVAKIPLEMAHSAVLVGFVLVVLVVVLSGRRAVRKRTDAASNRNSSNLS